MHTHVFNMRHALSFFSLSLSLFPSLSLSNSLHISYIQLGIQSYCQLMIGVSNHFRIVFRFHMVPLPLLERDWISRVHIWVFPKIGVPPDHEF